MEFRVLGPLEVVEKGDAVDLGGPRQRALLAYLLVHANEAVAAERLLEDLWGGSAPGANAVQVTVSRLRKALGGDDRLRKQRAGYLLEVEPAQLDAARFGRAHSEGSRLLGAGDAAASASKLREALALWRGPALADFRYEPFAQAEIARLEEARLDCLVERIDADLALGGHAKLIGELEALTAEHPLQERLRAQLMLALYRCGRQADALGVYRITRELFDRELGIEPGPALRRLEAAILRQEGDLELESATIVLAPSETPAPGAEPPATRQAVRKTVTVLVSGLTEPASSATVDPELRRRLGDRALAQLGPVLERHGATVERLQDGRVMGVFGVPAAHEDDALRAVRAAVELRDSFAGGATTVEVGIDSGEVLTGDTGLGEPLITGSAVERAASLQSAKDASGILIGDETRGLVRDAIRVEPLSAREGVDGAGGWRLLDLLTDAPPFLRRFDAPLVGRDRELSQLCQAFERAVQERRAQLFTVFGEAGIGKTRLAHELARSLEAAATMLTGRCLSYGEGITYWPVREIVIQACGGRELRELLGELLGDDPDADAIRQRLESVLGTGTAGAVGEEIFWAVRKLAEALAGRRPLVLLFEDVHWGEPTLLDLIEHLADWLRSAPVLILCLARPELLDGRATWGGGKLNATSILLEPVSYEESSLLIGALTAGRELSPQSSRRITEAAEGNPLFLEQMLAMLVEENEEAAEVPVPPAIQALLATRLDHLTADERHVIARASVEGELFHVDAVADLSSETREEVTSRLVNLVRKELIRPELSALAGQEAFGFRHALIRDAAYAGLPKRARADLHERYAGWLERTLADRAVEGEELLAYHLEQAHRYRTELGMIDAATEALANRAGRLFASAGRRAFKRGDWPATVNLSQRALALLSSHSTLGRSLMPDLVLALYQMGLGERADAVAEEAIRASDAADDPAVRALATVTRTYCAHWLRPDLADLVAMRREGEHAFAIFDELDDDAGRCRAMFSINIAAWASGNIDECARLAKRALGFARRAGIRPDELECCAGFLWSICFGTTAASEGRRQIQRVVLGSGRDQSLQALALTGLALLDGMDGRLSQAEEAMEEGRRAFAELGLHHWVWQSAILAAQLAMLAGDFRRADQVLREALEMPGASADRFSSTWARAELARALHAEGQYEQALAITDAIDAAPIPVAVSVQMRCRGARALVLSALGKVAEAERLAKDVVKRGRTTDGLNFQADALVDFAEILHQTQRNEDAATQLTAAVALYERKGNAVSAERTRHRLRECGISSARSQAERRLS